MRTLLVASMLVLATAACDRRNDPDVDPARTGSSSPPGAVVDATPAPAATTPATTPTTVPPTTAEDCEGRAGTEGCPPTDGTAVPTQPQPSQPPPTRP